MKTKANINPALASAADISCLEICSRTPRSRNTWSIILKVIGITTNPSTSSHFPLFLG